MGRFVLGISVAVSAVADVSYLAEVAPKGLRGAMVSTNELAISVGMLGAFLMGHLLRDVHGEFGDRFTAASRRRHAAGVGSFCRLCVANVPTTACTPPLAAFNRRAQAR